MVIILSTRKASRGGTWPRLRAGMWQEGDLGSAARLGPGAGVLPDPLGAEEMGAAPQPPPESASPSLAPQVASAATSCL